MSEASVPTLIAPGVVRHTAMVSMRDGVRLACDIYLPGEVDPMVGPAFPTLLERTPYDRRGVYRSERTRSNAEPMQRQEVAAFFVRRGYAVVYQDCRGRYGSEGQFTKYLGEGPDGYDTLAWLCDQAFCNGRIGTMGMSYAAHTQSAAACLDPPGLACMLLDSGGFSNAFQGAVRQGGALELKQATWAWKHARLSRMAREQADVAAALDAEDIRDWFSPSRMPWRAGASPISAVPEYEAYLLEQWRHGDFDAYWKQVGLYAAGYYDRYANVPTLHMSSWYDPYARTATENFLGMKAAGKGPLQLVLGPWIHGARSVTHAGDADFGAAATLDGNLAEDYLHFRLAWFDAWLQQQPDALLAQPAVRYFRMGGGSGRRNSAGRLDHGGGWLACADWPPADVEMQAFHLHADGALARQAPQPGDTPLQFRYDPLNPVPTIGGAITSGAPIMEGGGFDQRESPDFFGSHPPYRPLAERDDVLVFSTAPLETDVEVTGALEAEFWVASDCPDTDITVKLIDWYPPGDDYPEGYALNITNGILRLRYRDSWEKPTLLVPGEVVRVRIELMPSSNLFKAGHRLRIDVSSSNYPHFDLNPNTGEPEGDWCQTRVATNAIFVDAKRPSRVWLPVRRIEPEEG